MGEKGMELEEKEGNWVYCGLMNEGRWVGKKEVYEVEVRREVMGYVVEVGRE